MNRLKILIGLAAAFAFAAGTDAGANKGGTKTLTGCLQKGVEAGTYKLTDVTGGPEATDKAMKKEWELVEAPASLKLDDHVGHKVEITGSVVGSAAATKVEEKSTTTTTGTGKTETTKTSLSEESMHRHLKVSSMKHVAATCP
jgi:hypothetical protein